MESVLSKVVAIIIAVVLLFVVPLISSFDRQDDMTYNYVYNETNLFVDTVRDTGYLTSRQYENYMAKINATGNSYDVTLQHKEKYYMKDPSTTNSAIVYYDSSFNYEILEGCLYNTSLPAADRVYHFEKGDFFVVEIKNVGMTRGEAFKKSITKTGGLESSIFVRIGGMINNESD